MSNPSDDFGIAVIKELCPICCKEMDSLIIGKKRDKKYAKRINELNGKTVKFADNPCPECQKLINENDCLIVIGVDSEKTTDMKNPYRSGHIVGITKNCDFYKNLPEEFKKYKALLMDVKEMMQYGLINKA